MYLQSKIQTLLLQDGFYTIKNQFFLGAAAAKIIFSF